MHGYLGAVVLGPEAMWTRGSEFTLTVLVATLAVMLLGPGALSVDRSPWATPFPTAGSTAR